MPLDACTYRARWREVLEKQRAVARLPAQEMVQLVYERLSHVVLTVGVFLFVCEALRSVSE